MAEKAKVLLFSMMVKVTCWSDEARRVGFKESLHSHQRLGKLLGLVLEAKHLRLRLTNHRRGRSSISIQGSESKMMSGLC
jgi:hypothetical protein